MERYEVVRQELDRVASELSVRTLSEEKRKELRTERRRLEDEFFELARKKRFPPGTPHAT